MASGFLSAIGLIPNALIAPPGTRLPFNQSAPPLGWTNDVSGTMNDCSMRVNSGSGGQTGGSTVWSSWNFGGTFNVNTFTINAGQLPAHSHNGSGTTGTSNQSLNHTHFGGLQTFSAGGQGASGSPNFVDQRNTDATDLTSHNHNFGFTTDGGNGLFNNGIQPNYTTPQVKFTDFIIGIKA